MSSSARVATNKIRQAVLLGLPLNYVDRGVTESCAKDKSAELNMAFFDEVSRLHEQQVRLVGVHLVSVVCLGAI